MPRLPASGLKLGDFWQQLVANVFDRERADALVTHNSRGIDEECFGRFVNTKFHCYAPVSVSQQIIVRIAQLREPLFGVFRLVFPINANELDAQRLDLFN